MSTCKKFEVLNVYFCDSETKKISSMHLTALVPSKIIKDISRICYKSISSKSKMTSDNMLRNVITCIPPLDNSSHKGQAGRISIIGGSLEYTGAPYFSGISALRVGADLVHIFCTKSAATVIKSYSPELIVHPLLDWPNATEEISQWFERIHVIVIGPGLGRQKETFSVVSELIEIIREKRIPLVIDADGLFLITEKPHLLKDFISPVILTPNKVEFDRLWKKIGSPPCEGVTTLGPYVTILKKGETDELLSPVKDLTWQSNKGGSGRRCGGQGDLLAGSIGTFLNWTLANQNKIDLNVCGEKCLAAASISCFAACRLIRQCNEKAFKVKGRSMLASDMIEYIHECFEEIFGQ